MVSPRAKDICTPTPNLCLYLPTHCSLMNEKARVMAGLAPNPIKNNPNPMIRGESAIATIRTETVPMIQATLIATFLPELSATFGITKKPANDPKNSIDCRIGMVFSN